MILKNFKRLVACYLFPCVVFVKEMMIVNNHKVCLKIPRGLENHLKYKEILEKPPPLEIRRNFSKSIQEELWIASKLSPKIPLFPYELMTACSQWYLSLYSFTRNDREEQVMTCNETSRPKSLIAILAERRKVQKSIYSFAPNTIPSVPTRTSKPNISSSGGSVDILGDILASQTQLKCFGKPESLLNPPVRSVTSRVLSAILASKDTLSRLDRDLEQFTKGVNNGADSATPNSQKQQCASGGGSKSNQLPASNTRQVAESATPVNNGASNGGDDPDGNRRKRKSEPEDKPEEADEEESVEEESESMENSIKAQVNQVKLILY